MLESRESLPVREDLFVSIACPLCGSSDFEVELPSRYPASVDADELQRMFCASSDHQLLDQLVTCRSCSLTYVNPRLRSDLILKGYADAEDPRFAEQNDARTKAFRRTLQPVIRRLGLEPRGRRLLDVGCAGGAFLVAARKCGFDVTGVEPSRWMAAFGRAKYNLDIRDGILDSRMFPEHSFDVITLWDVVEHLPEPHEVLELIHRLLRPGGILLVNYPDVSTVAARILGRRWPFWLSVHLLYYTPRTISAQLQRAGFSPLWQESFWPVLPLGYVAERAAPYSRLLTPLPWMIRALRLGSVPLPYNMGQTLVVSRLGASS